MFRDRQDAGQQLAERLHLYRGKNDAVVIGLPRGGVVVAAETAKALHLPLDIIVPRKIGAEHNPEYAIGAITETGQAIWNEIERRDTHPEYLVRQVAEAQAEAKRRLDLYRKNRQPRDLKNKTVILIDDGVATGLTMLAAVETAQKEGAKHLVIAVPIAAADAIPVLIGKSDEIVVLYTEKFFTAIGEFYEHFEQTSDEEVIRLLMSLRGVRQLADDEAI